MGFAWRPLAISSAYVVLLLLCFSITLYKYPVSMALSIASPCKVGSEADGAFEATLDSLPQ